MDARRRSGGLAPTVAAKHRAASVNLRDCRYAVVEHAALSLGWTVSRKPAPAGQWNVWWQDKSVLPARVLKLQEWQRINHLPGMSSICSKTRLARTMRRLGPDDAVSPESWLLPAELGALQDAVDANARRGRHAATYILKPEAGSQGKGIFLVRRPEHLAKRYDGTAGFVAQEYIPNPLLVQGRKFDLRLYVLVTSVSPLRVFLFDDGLVRLCAAPYRQPTASNLGSAQVHLTNVAINRPKPGTGTPTMPTSARAEGSPLADAPRASGASASTAGPRSSDKTSHSRAGAALDDDSGLKRSVHWLLGHLQDRGIDSAAVWARVADAVNKAVLAAEPELDHAYRSCSPSGSSGTQQCFELLGLDVMLDADLRPWVVEVNHSPSLVCDSALDWRVKHGAVSEALDMLAVRWSDRRAAKRARGLRSRSRLYGPAPSTDEVEATHEDGGPAGGESRVHRLQRLRARHFWRILPTPGSEPADLESIDDQLARRAVKQGKRAKLPVDLGRFGPGKFQRVDSAGFPGAAYDPGRPWGRSPGAAATFVSGWQEALAALGGRYDGLRRSVAGAASLEAMGTPLDTCPLPDTETAGGEAKVPRVRPRGAAAMGASRADGGQLGDSGRTAAAPRSLKPATADGAGRALRPPSVAPAGLPAAGSEQRVLGARRPHLGGLVARPAHSGAVAPALVTVRLNAAHWHVRDASRRRSAGTRVRPDDGKPGSSVPSAVGARRLSSSGRRSGHVVSQLRPDRSRYSR